MLEELTSELLITGFVALVHRLWEFLNREEFDESFLPIELAEMPEQEYHDFVVKYSGNAELN